MVIGERLYTAEEFWEMSSELGDDKLHELVRGVIVEMSRPGALHGIVVSLIISLLQQFVTTKRLGIVTSETGFALFGNNDTVRGPDVAFVAAERVPKQIPEGWFYFAPDIAIEVVSPNDLASEIQEKVEEYLEAGSRAVWVFYPKTKSINIHEGNITRRLSEKETLEGGKLLPEFSVPVKQFFP